MSADNTPGKDSLHKERLVIEKPSQDLLFHAISQFPLKPVFGEINLGTIRSEGDEYLGECIDKKILPHTTLRLKWNEAMGVFDYEKIEVLPIMTKNEALKARSTFLRTLRLLSGEAKHAEINVNLSGLGLDRFTYFMLNPLKNDGYHINNSFLAVTAYETRDNPPVLGGKRMDTGVFLSPHSISVEWGHNCTEEQRQKLTEWFNKLQQVHGPNKSPQK